mgnify:CR=1 FL=1
MPGKRRENQIALWQEEIPHRIDPETYEITTRIKCVFQVDVTFHGSEIRRGR